MLTVADLKKKLAELPDDAIVTIFEGSSDVIVVTSKEGEEIMVIDTEGGGYE